MGRRHRKSTPGRRAMQAAKLGRHRVGWKRRRAGRGWKPKLAGSRAGGHQGTKAWMDGVVWNRRVRTREAESTAKQQSRRSIFIPGLLRRRLVSAQEMSSLFGSV